MEDIGSIVSVICDSSSYLRMAGPALKAIAKVRLLFLRELQFPDQLLIVRKPRERTGREDVVPAQKSIRAFTFVRASVWASGCPGLGWLGL